MKPSLIHTRVIVRFHEETDERADCHTGTESDRQRQRQDPVQTLHVHEHEEDAQRDTGRDARRQVDLSEEDDKDECHAEHDECGRLRHEIREIALGGEHRAQDGEQVLSHGLDVGDQGVWGVRRQVSEVVVGRWSALPQPRWSTPIVRSRVRSLAVTASAQ
jgi:hypothetical protein